MLAQFYKIESDWMSRNRIALGVMRELALIHPDLDIKRAYVAVGSLILVANGDFGSLVDTLIEDGWEIKLVHPGATNLARFRHGNMETIIVRHIDEN